jgi:hypothetical protein
MLLPSCHTQLLSFQFVSSQLVQKRPGIPEARAVFSGEQAIELLESFQPEMLIADVVMPGMTGIEAAIAIRNKLQSAIFFSSQDRPLPPSCWNGRGRRVMNLKSSLNRYIRPIYLRSCVCLVFSIPELQPSRAATFGFSVVRLFSIRAA